MQACQVCVRGELGDGLAYGSACRMIVANDATDADRVASAWAMAQKRKPRPAVACKPAGKTCACGWGGVHAPCYGDGTSASSAVSTSGSKRR